MNPAPQPVAEPVAEDLPIRVAALYRFVRFEDPAALRGALYGKCAALGIKGTLLLAHEGINGTIAGEAASIAAIVDHIREIEGCSDIGVKYSGAAVMPFKRLKVRCKREIVTMGVTGIDPSCHAGVHVEPDEWNALIREPDTLLVDTRNDYEIAIGSFVGAINPETSHFRQFPDWLHQKRQEWHQKGSLPRLAMFCTGGIRCEKSTAFAKSIGFDEVYHLKGGILRYLEQIPPEQSLWQGDCFVFDDRVAVGHGLRLGAYSLCHACRRPMTEEDKRSPSYREGVSCPHCVGTLSEKQMSRFSERQKQVLLARHRGGVHIGAPARAGEAEARRSCKVSGRGEDS